MIAKLAGVFISRLLKTRIEKGRGQTGASRSKTSCEVPERTLGRISIVVKLPNSRA
jgi:hypothetical protein